MKEYSFLTAVFNKYCDAMGGYCSELAVSWLYDGKWKHSRCERHTEFLNAANKYYEEVASSWEEAQVFEVINS